uniref:UDP-glucuronosyltransferase n=1 Tax=Lissorhoptrus oryzophilus TaxID=308863 RepID=A0A2R4FXJ3_9CUCU|nr:UDP-glucuronosyltransferase 328B1 [Lissorhoptrus oryzophilus]
MKLRIFLINILTFVSVFSECECYNILVIFGHPGKSHYDVFKPLFQELGERGHNITILSHVSTKGDIKNGRDVLISNEAMMHILDVNWFTGSRLQQYMEANLIAYLGDMTCEPGLQSKELQNFLKEDNQFDVILVEFFNSNCFYGIINKFKAPFIGLSSCSMMAWHSQWFGSPDNPSYIPSIYMAHLPPMTFLERVENTLVHLAHKLWYTIFMEKPGSKLSKQYIGFEPADPYNASLYLVNTHYSLHGVKPLVPGIVEVGGIHVATKEPKKLPQDIERWTNESTSGLIYFSLGSLLKGHTFPDDKRQIFNKAFSKLPQRVLWKWETTMKDKPNNVMISKWTPQFDILCHPNTILFISHGGLLGTTEAVHCGVPVLVMPQFGDQKLNAAMLQKQGSAVIIQLQTITEESLAEALTKALSPEIRKKAKELSERFRDRIVSPLQTAVYWVEYVAKYNGAKHIRSAAVDMPFYQYFLLDVIAFLGFLVLASTFIIYKSFRFILGKIFSRKGKVKTS